ncbi:MAG: hypothetical protein OEV21_06650, partial [Thermoplasmata archaeon]|nr:hypothetical protein [Thermoplasmata archaeon]
MKWRINLLCIGGAFLGFIVIFSPWVIQTMGRHSWNIFSTSYSLFNLYPYPNWPITILQFLSDISFLAPSILILLFGLVISFISPLGGLIQIAGLIIFTNTIYPAIGNYFPYYFMTIEFGIGFYLAIYAMILVTVSFFLPIGIGYQKRIKYFGDRLLVWNPLPKVLLESISIVRINKLSILGALITALALPLSWIDVSSDSS